MGGKRKATQVVASSGRKLSTGPKFSPKVTEQLIAATKMPPTRMGWKMEDAISHLCEVEPRFHAIVEKHGIPNRLFQSKRKTPYTTLVQAIIYQQIAGAAAATVYNRFCGALNMESSENDILPETVRDSTFDIQLIEGKKKIFVNGTVSGLSSQKAEYIRSLTAHFLDPKLLKDVDFGSIGDEELVKRLTAVKGEKC